MLRLNALLRCSSLVDGRCLGRSCALLPAQLLDSRVLGFRCPLTSSLTYHGQRAVVTCSVDAMT